MGLVFVLPGVWLGWVPAAVAAVVAAAAAVVAAVAVAVAVAAAVAVVVMHDPPMPQVCKDLPHRQELRPGLPRGKRRYQELCL